MAKVKFDTSNTSFYQALKKETDRYFRENGISKTGNWHLYSKALVLLPMALGIYGYLLLGNPPAWLGLLLCSVMGLVISSIGFNIMHDACHGSYSSRKWVNDVLGLSLNCIGGNAFFWKQKHNILHHTYTNIEGIDDDIAQSRLLRQSPTQEWLPIHRYQHRYLPVAYAMTLFVWIGMRDFDKYFRKKIHNTPLQPMSTSEHVVFWLSKALYGFFYVALPIMLVGFGAWAAGFATMCITAGIVLSYTFQLAHAVEGPEFEAAGLDDRTLECEWAAHQVRTTANFAPDNWLINWYVGGLNYQVEHHLFPRISHVHYPALSKIVREQCAIHGLPYHSFPDVSSAIRSHMRTIRQLGQKPELAAA
ncbi:MAG: acyl-CoA desaturase [Sphingobacteriales bacterium]|nr:MAG: acyl-CoA desaturase [Sphingobacteriales bacterium]